jgi:hypothetical protein
MAASEKFLVAAFIQWHPARSLDIASVATSECPRATVTRRDSRRKVSSPVLVSVEIASASPV